MASLRDAVQAGDLEKVKAWAAAGEDLKQSLTEGGTLLHLAVRLGRRPVVAYLLVQGLDPNALDEKGATPLHEAALRGHAVLADVLIRRGAALNPQTQQGNTPLHCAVAGGHPQVVSGLLAQGASVSPRNQQGQTPLHLAAARGAMQAAQSLAQAGANLHAADEQGRTPAEEARAQGHTELADWLAATPKTHPASPPDEADTPAFATLSAPWEEAPSPAPRPLAAPTSAPAPPPALLGLLAPIKWVLALAAVGLIWLAMQKTTPLPALPDPAQLASYDILSGGNQRVGFGSRLQMDIKGLGMLWYEAPDLLPIQQAITLGKKLQVWAEPPGGSSPTAGRVWQIAVNGQMLVSFEQAKAHALTLRQRGVLKNTLLFGVPAFIAILLGLTQAQEAIRKSAPG